MRRLLAFLDPLLGRPPLVIEPHHCATGQAQVCDDKADSRKQLPDVELRLRYYSPRHLPTELLTKEENLIGLMALNRETLGQAECLDSSDHVAWRRSCVQATCTISGSFNFITALPVNHLLLF